VGLAGSRPSIFLLFFLELGSLVSPIEVLDFFLPSFPVPGPQRASVMDRGELHCLSWPLF